jgi:deazaflavin-dependent oxidoreductase (nitroreductase family)
MAITDHIFRGVLKTHQALYERTDGRIGENLFGTKALLLRTKGRKSGQVRTAALTFATDGDRYLIVASKGGAPTPPTWLANLRASPECEIQIGRHRHRVTARPTLPDDPDYARRWTIVNAVNKDRYTQYQKKTERPIAIVELRARASG